MDTIEKINKWISSKKFKIWYIKTNKENKGKINHLPISKSCAGTDGRWDRQWEGMDTKLQSLVVDLLKPPVDALHAVEVQPSSHVTDPRPSPYIFNFFDGIHLLTFSMASIYQY